MTVDEVMRIRKNLSEMYQGSIGTPTTRLIRTFPDGYLLEIRMAGTKTIVASEQDLDRLIERNTLR